jgi:hypothetical protein
MVLREVTDMAEPATVEDRIIARFIETIGTDRSVPPEVARRITSLWKNGQLKDADAILTMIKEGVRDDAKNSPT